LSRLRSGYLRMGAVRLPTLVGWSLTEFVRMDIPPGSFGSAWSEVLGEVDYL